MSSAIGTVGRAVRDALNSADPTNFTAPYDTWQTTNPAAWEWSPSIHVTKLESGVRVGVAPYLDEALVYDQESDDRRAYYRPTVSVVIGVVAKLTTLTADATDVATDAEVDGLALFSEELIRTIVQVQLGEWGLPRSELSAIPALDDTLLLQRIYSSWHALRYTAE